MRFRPLLILAAAITAVALPSGLSAEASAKAGATTDGISIVRTFTGWRDAASFKRISEYFSGQENLGVQTILRTHPEQRTGYYFLLRLANAGAPRPVRIQLQLINQGAAAPATVVFPTTLQAGSGVFQLGLTGPEWRDAKSQPVAWHIQILDDDQVMASEKSYLWEKPASK